MSKDIARRVASLEATYGTPLPTCSPAIAAALNATIKRLAEHPEQPVTEADARLLLEKNGDRWIDQVEDEFWIEGRVTAFIALCEFAAILETFGTLAPAADVVETWAQRFRDKRKLSPYLPPTRYAEHAGKPDGVGPWPVLQAIQHIADLEIPGRRDDCEYSYRLTEADRIAARHRSAGYRLKDESERDAWRAEGEVLSVKAAIAQVVELGKDTDWLERYARTQPESEATGLARAFVSTKTKIPPHETG
ncbi:hypothetical protein [Denitromonas ohlonensis]|uniref:Uncharacterized protein n=2 Tax=Denitromonas TaxID=139331 RepID=A0A557SQ40_9RHOO|nr:hypothetical protein [Denitromonas ohlonensis]TVO65941.1 hypothetical protein FHP90_10745 [Denitromonas ohlonensis]TVO79534.1 hypothetical protein FHP89_01930 [Denitromonas ohlonensis]